MLKDYVSPMCTRLFDGYYPHVGYIFCISHFFAAIRMKTVKWCLYIAELQDWKFTSRKFIWVKVYKNDPSEVCGREPLKNLK